MWEYTEELMEHFKNPRNVGEVENYDAIGEVGNITCGDALKLTLKINKETEVITEAKFQTYGCASAIASSSVLTEIVKGKTIEQASKLTNKDIADFLGGMPEEKLHCSVMGMEALEKAINGYRGVSTPEKIVEEGEKIVCKCFGVSDKKIERSIKENNLKTVEEVTNYTKAGGGCGACKPDIEKILKKCRENELSEHECQVGPTVKEKKKLTNIERISLIQDTIEREIRPTLKSDGGDIELVDIDRNKVYIKFLGSCLGCPSSGVTKKLLVESKLKEFVENDIVIEEVK